MENQYLLVIRLDHTWDEYIGEDEVKEITYIYPLDPCHKPDRFDESKGFEIVEPYDPGKTLKGQENKQWK